MTHCDAQELRHLNVDGKKILNEPVAAAVNPDSRFGTLDTAASGAQTWQPRELQQGYSVFGGSIIDGLDVHHKMRWPVTGDPGDRAHHLRQRAEPAGAVARIW